MPNRILHVELINHSTVPSEAEVFLNVLPEKLGDHSEVRGRLMGPVCHHASTVEVAYHFRPVLLPTARPAVTLRAIIPEASPWSPQTPHLYKGVVELWHEGQRIDGRPLLIGLRDFRVGPRGLRCNGHLLALRGKRVETVDDETALALRAQGMNLLVCPVSPRTRAVWEVANRIGFAVLGEIAAGYPGLLLELATHPSCLGWLLGPDAPSLDSLPNNTIVVAPHAHPAAAKAQVILAQPGFPIPAAKAGLLTADGETNGPLVGVLVG
jgi:hypothetical protein